MPKLYDSIVDTIGDTPLIRLNSISTDDVTFYAKVEAFNPGRSSKDRIAVPMIEDAERRGLLRPGGTIIEATSGNTGLALALVGIRKGYRVVLVIPDKMSPEKINLVKSIGCEVIVCPTEVSPDDPRSYYSVAEKLSKEIPNSFWARQYWNESNPVAHYETTGPEVWTATGGEITHFVAGVGTGGTISGSAKFLKERNPDVVVIAPDPEGSILAHYHQYRNTDVEARGYKVEGVGEDIIPANVHFEFIDHFVKVSDSEAFEWTRKLAREEGLFVGGSSGLAVAGAVKYGDYPPGSVVVVILPDTGERYLGKVFSDRWMRTHGFLPPVRTTRELLEAKPPTLQGTKSVTEKATWDDAIEKFKKFEEISYLVIEGEDGSCSVLERRELYARIARGEISSSEKIDSSSLRTPVRIGLQTTFTDLRDVLVEENMVLVEDRGDVVGLLTLSDLVENGGFIS